MEHTLPTLEHRIRQRAYEIWSAEGRADGKADEHWLAAEREVLSSLIARSPASKARAPMAENFKCSHCGALYEIIADEKTVSEDLKDAATCRVCGKQMDVKEGSSIRHYELAKMPGGTNV